MYARMSIRVLKSSFFYRGFSPMCFLLYADVEEDILTFSGIGIEKEGAGKYDVYVCTENKTLRINSKLGYEDKMFNSYDELLFNVVLLGKVIYADTMIEKLDKAEHEISHNQMYLPLMTEGNEIEQLITQIRRVREGYAKYNFRLVIKLGRLYEEYVEDMLNKEPAVKYAIDKAKEHAKEICYKSDDPDVTYWCDSYDPFVHAEVYAVPEDKRIIIAFYVEDVGEVYRHVRGYQTAEEFLKALEGFYGMVS